MTITIPPELAKRLEESAKLHGTTPEAQALGQLERATPDWSEFSPETLAWIARLTAHAIPVHTNPGLTFSREEIYD